SGMCKIGGTNQGPNTQSRAGDATLTFGNLTANGQVIYQTLETNQAGPMPFGYNSPLEVSDISVTAFFNGGITTCFNLPAVTDAIGAPVSGVTINLSGTQSRETITDSSGRYSFDNVETNGFYTVTPSRANYTFSPGNRSFSLLGVHTDASFTASANCINRLT